jgi:hypothetical protein
LRDSGVLTNAIQEGLGCLTWQKDTFAYADSYDDANGRYLGLRGGQNVFVSDDAPTGLLVKADVAWKQIEAERPAPATAPAATSSTTTAAPSNSSTPTPPDPANPPLPVEPKKPNRFHGTVELDPQRVGRDAGKIAEEVIAHLSSLVGANVTVRLDIEAKIASGVPDNVVRIVTENGRTLKFTSQGFETD